MTKPTADPTIPTLIADGILKVSAEGRTVAITEPCFAHDVLCELNDWADRHLMDLDLCDPHWGVPVTRRTHTLADMKELTHAESRVKRRHYEVWCELVWGEGWTVEGKELLDHRGVYTADEKPIPGISRAEIVYGHGGVEHAHSYEQGDFHEDD